MGSAKLPKLPLCDATSVKVQRERELSNYKPLPSSISYCSKWLTKKSVSHINLPYIVSVLNTIAGSSDSNQAVEISIVQAGQESPKTLSTFHPKFTYPIFGDQESIFGYQGLRIGIRFAAHDLRSNIQITHDKQFKSVGDTKATNIEETLRDWIPSSKSLLILHFYSTKRLNG